MAGHQYLQKKVETVETTTQVGQRSSRQQSHAASDSSGWGRASMWSLVGQKVGVTEEERLFLKQVHMETREDVGIFNYPQIYSNFLPFLTTPPAEGLNKEAWGS